MKLLLVDKREIFREGLARILADQPGIESVKTCSYVSEIIGQIREVQPDIVIIDIELEEDNCLELARRIYELLPRTRILILTHSEQNCDVFSAIKAGAYGYLSKDITIDELVEAIRIVAHGGIIISPQVAVKILGEFASLELDKEKKLEGRESALSIREKEVLRLVTMGARNKEIAQALFISENTVKGHLHNIMEKLQAHSRLQAVFLAKESEQMAHADGETANKAAM